MSRGPRIRQSEVNRIIGLKVADPLMPNSAIAKAVGRSDDSVGRVAERFKALIATYSELKATDIINDIDCVRRAYLAHAAEPETIKKSSALQAVTSYAVLTDKLLLESGRPTSITLSANVDATMPDILGRLKRALEARGQATRSSDGQVKQELT